MKENDIIVRSAVYADMEAVRNIFNYYVRHSAATFTETESTLSEITDKYTHVRAREWPFLVAQEQSNGTIAGFAYLSDFRAQTAYRIRETTIYLHPDCTGKGVGTPLYAKLIQESGNAKDVDNLIAVITADNTASIRFHQKFGFTLRGTLLRAGYKFETWHDVALWGLPLNQA